MDKNRRPPCCCSCLRYCWYHFPRSRCRPDCTTLIVTSLKIALSSSSGSCARRWRREIFRYNELEIIMLLSTLFFVLKIHVGVDDSFEHPSTRLLVVTRPREKYIRFLYTSSPLWFSFLYVVSLGTTMSTQLALQSTHQSSIYTYKSIYIYIYIYLYIFIYTHIYIMNLKSTFFFRDKKKPQNRVLVYWLQHQN